MEQVRATERSDSSSIRLFLLASAQVSSSILWRYKLICVLLKKLKTGHTRPVLSETTRLSLRITYLTHTVMNGRTVYSAFFKERHWCNGFSAGPYNLATQFASFRVWVQLTEKGRDYEDSIVEILLGYLLLIKDVGVQEWIFDETCSVSKVMFQFEE